MQCSYSSIVLRAMYVSCAREAIINNLEGQIYDFTKKVDYDHFGEKTRVSFAEIC